jgi:hypothetical protein
MKPKTPEPPPSAANVGSPAEVQAECAITTRLIQTLRSAADKRPDLLDVGLRENVAEAVQKSQAALTRVEALLGTYTRLALHPPPPWGTPVNKAPLNEVKTELDGALREMIAERKLLQILMDVIAL